MAGHVNTSFGNMSQSGEILMPNPGFVSSTATEVCTLTCGDDTFSISHRKAGQDHEVIVKKNGVQEQAPYVAFNYAQVGFANRYDDNTQKNNFYYVCCDDVFDLPSTIIPNTGTGGGGSYPYNAILLGSYVWDDIAEDDREWDTSPSTAPIADPGNMNSRGGEGADTMPFDTTDLQFAIPDGSEWDIDISTIMTLYQFDSATLANFGQALFENDFWTNLKNKFTGLSDPLSMITNCYQLPVDGTGTTGVTVKLGGIQVGDGVTPVTAKKITQRTKQLTFGEINLKEVWGSAKDYTDIDVRIFLPFVGEKSLDPDIVVGSKLTLYANIDMWTGDIVYLLHTKYTQTAKYISTENTPYRWTGNCARHIPLGRVDTTGAILKLIGSGISLAGGIAASAATGNAAGMVAGAAGAVSMLGTGIKPTIQSSSNVSGTPGYMDYTYPYLMIKRGVPQYPNGWREQIGAPRYQAFVVSSLSGYTAFSEIHADNITEATDAEKSMIENQMKAGIFI